MQINRLIKKGHKDGLGEVRISAPELNMIVEGLERSRTALSTIKSTKGLSEDKEELLKKIVKLIGETRKTRQEMIM